MKGKFNNKKVNIILGIIVIVLAVMCIYTITEPIRFTNIQIERENAVKERLKKIRSAESRFQSTYGYFCGSVDSLVSTGYLADSLKYIPYSNNKKFKIETSMITTKSGKTLPVMECSARYEDYLYGLSESGIQNAIEDANERGVFPGMKIGDLTTPSDNVGNWE